MDCAVTRAIADTLCPQAKEHAETTYRFVRAMQGPALDMMLRGVAIQPQVRISEEQALSSEEKELRALLDRLALAVWQLPLNPDSPKQMNEFFYGALKMEPQYALRKTPEGKKKTLSCDAKALETLEKLETKGPNINPYDRAWVKVHLARPFVTLIGRIRVIGKRLNVVRSKLSADGRWRTSYGVGSTVTGRWNSQKNAFNEGDNQQNVTPRMRRMVCSDDGWKLAAPDLEQAESRVVAALVWQVTGDDSYWRACESEDLHTGVIMMCYPELPWPGTLDVATFTFSNMEACKRWAESHRWHRHLHYRDGAKRIGHGSNYWGSSYGIAHTIGIEPKVVGPFQLKYFRAFPGIARWHQKTIATVQTTQRLVTPFGRERVFFGRVFDDSTLREAIAHVPQSTIADMTNEGIRRLWAYGLEHPQFRRAVQLLQQNHDSSTFQYPDHPEWERWVLAKAKELLSVPIPITRPNDNLPCAGETRVLTVPLEFKTGYNWGLADPDKRVYPDGNPDGLSKYKGHDARRRTTPARPSLDNWLDQRL